MPQISITTKYTLLLAASLVTAVAAGSAQAAGVNIKCWKNDLGIRECGNSVPPEYSQKRIEVLNDRGIVVKVIQPPKTPEQLQKEQEQALRQKQKAEAKKQQQRQDNILLNSYATERDLIMARDTNVKAAKAELDIAQSNLKMQQNVLEQLQNKAGDYERRGKQPPKRLIKRIDSTKQNIASKQATIHQREQSMKAMKARYARDLARFRKLKGLSN
ncbi:MAG: hypothetical protein P8Z75_03940 [Gammaproteobacteria bacterium]|jgi:hypothetical protein